MGSHFRFGLVPSNVASYRVLGRLTHLMRVYYHSPLPPAKTGIADYSVELLPLLAKHVDVELVAARDALTDADRALAHELGVGCVTYSDRSTRASAGALDIYQLGNNTHHFEILLRSITRPGLAVIHDASFMGLLSSVGSELRDRFTEYELGAAAQEFVSAQRSFLLYHWQEFLVRNLGLVVDSSKGVLVHSDYAFRLISRRYRQPNVHRIHHHVAEAFTSSVNSRLENASAASFLLANRGRLKIGTFGFLTPPKRIDWLVKAFSHALQKGLDGALLLAGEPHRDTGIDRLVADLPPERVCVTGFLSETDMRSLMSSIDLQVSLRFPSVGESSGTLTRSLGLGTPAIVTDHESFGDFSSDMVEKVRLDAGIVDSLACAFLSLAEDPGRFREKGRKAREWVLKHASLAKSVEGYVEAIRAASSARGRVIFPDIAGEVQNCVEKSFSERFDKPGPGLLKEVADRLFRAQPLRRLSSNFGCELLVTDSGEELTPEELVESGAPLLQAGGRKLVVNVSSTEITADELHVLRTTLGCSRFDLLALVLVDIRACRRPPAPQRWAAHQGLDPKGFRTRSRGKVQLRGPETIESLGSAMIVVLEVL